MVGSILSRKQAKLLLLLLLCQALVAEVDKSKDNRKLNESMLSPRNNDNGSLFLVDGFELDRFVTILPPACRATSIKILFDMMPTETTDLVLPISTTASEYKPLMALT